MSLEINRSVQTGNQSISDINKIPVFFNTGIYLQYSTRYLQLKKVYAVLPLYSRYSSNIFQKQKNMKPILTALLLPLMVLCCSNLGSNRADKSLVCDNGKIHFLASTAIEDIEATSNSAVCAINLQTKKISAKVKMETLEFRRKKMQDDFNEDYIESSKFPYATLDAVIVSKINFSKDGTYDVTLKGTFEVHGVKKDREIKGKLTIKNGQPVSASAWFDVQLVDHNIKVPTIVVVKIATVVKVDVNFIFRKQDS